MAPLYWTFAMPSYRPKPSSGRDIATSGRNSLGASSRLGCSSNAWTTRCRWGPLSSAIPQPNGTADSASPKQTVEVERKFNCASKHAIQACSGASQATAAVEPSGLHCPSLRNNADPFGKNILGPRAGFVPQLVGFWGLSAGRRFRPLRAPWSNEEVALWQRVGASAPWWLRYGLRRLSFVSEWPGTK